MKMETATKTQVARTVRLAELGLTRASADLATLLTRKRKLAVAYEHYRYVTPENVAAFNKRLLEKTGKNMQSVQNMEYQVLDFTPIADYPTVPPDDVLTQLEVAHGRECFDAFEIAHIRNVKDPILFGRVDGTPNRFYVAQWETDISIDDLIKENEG